MCRLARVQDCLKAYPPQVFRPIAWDAATPILIRRGAHSWLIPFLTPLDT